MKRSCLDRGLAVFLAAAVCAPVFANSVYDIKVIGPTDTEHTRDDSYRHSSVSHLNEAGQAAGYASRYNGGSADMGRSAWLYNGMSTVNIGLTSVVYTRYDGYRNSYANYLNEAGQVAGTASRYNGGGTHRGYSTWLYNGTSTVDLSLTGTEHIRDDGYRSSSVSHLNEAGQVAGYARRYNGVRADLGRSAWLYNGTGTVNIGLTGTEHTRDDGYRYSHANFLSEAGQAAGNANRYNGGGTDRGQSAWLYNGTSTVNISLTGTEHTRDDGYQLSDVSSLNEAGQATGTAYRYNGGGIQLGQSAWLYNGTSTVNIGLTGIEHTRNNGYRGSYVHHLNEAGQAAGNASRYNGGATPVGNSAWLYNGTSTVDISLTGTEYTRNDGYRSSIVQHLNETGQAAGTAARYNGGATHLGRSAWLYNGTGTVDLSLTGTEYTRNDGYRASYVDHLSEAGQAAGYAERYNGAGTDLGRSAWLYNGTSTIDISLTGTVHTRNNGYRYSRIDQLNEAGQAVGAAYRYNGDVTQLGQTALFYDATIDKVYGMDFSVRSTDGYALSSFSFLGDDGLGLGAYSLFDSSGVSLGSRAFSFTVEDGFLDLGGLVADLSGEGWLYLASAYRANGAGHIIGSGLLDDMTSSSMAYLLAPQAVPVPAAVWLFGSGLVGLISVAQRKKSV